MEPIRKIANAFYTDGVASTKVTGVARFSGYRYKKKHGGLWVGGTVLLNRQGILFSPNAMNKKLHGLVGSVEIPASSIESLSFRFGWFTGVVEVAHEEGVFVFRCYGARKLVEQFYGSIKLP